jgi:methyl-accepting chemotaxis protein
MTTAGEGGKDSHEELLLHVTSLVDQLLLPQRVAARVLADLQLIGEAALSVTELARDLRSQVGPVRGWMNATAVTLESLSSEFGRANDEIARLREELIPELAGFRASADRLQEEMGQVISEMRALRGTVNALAREAGDISEVVEPLQSATDRVGKVADRLPGGRSKNG